MKIASVLASSACGGKWECSYISSLKNGKKAIVSGGDSDSGDLSSP